MKRWIHAKTDEFDFKNTNDSDGMLLKKYFEPYGLVVKYYPGTDEFVIAFPESPWPYSGCRKLTREMIANLDDKKIALIANAAKRASEKYYYNRRYITQELQEYINDLKRSGEFSWAYAEQINKKDNSTVSITLGPIREFAEKVSGEDPGPVNISAFPRHIKNAVDDRLDEIIEDVETFGLDFIKRINDSLGRSFHLKFEPK